MSTDLSRQALNSLLQLADVELNGKMPWDIQILDERAIIEIINQGSMGLGESYMQQWWSCGALDQLSSKLFQADLENKAKKNFQTLWLVLRSRLVNLQSIFFSNKVANMHYNIGNELYTKMLGTSMAYSCAYWKNARNLDEAQWAKYDLICKKLQLSNQDNLLDIGCGWGGLAAYATKHYGCQAVAVSNSQAQIDYAKRQFSDLPIEFYKADYRRSDIYNNNQRRFDKIVSVGFFEHVGYKNYQKFFKLVSQQLKDNGLFLLHTIGNNQTQYDSDPWINKYIFPYGMLPSMQQINLALEPYFIVEDWHNFGPDYDKTLMAWHHNFEQNWHELKDCFESRFYYMWRYYLLMCAGMFRARKAQLWQSVLSKPGFIGHYHSIR